MRVRHVREDGKAYTAMSRSRSVHSFMLGLFCSPSHHTISRGRAGDVEQEKECKRDKSEKRL
jgi:hypothetical protein